MPPKTRPPESKKGLIITLVFFILATLILGVATYFGFAEQEKLTKEKSEAQKNEKSAKDDRDWYKFQSQYYRAVMGLPTSVDKEFLATRKEQFDGGRLNPADSKDKEDVTKLIKEDLDKRFVWNVKEQKPDQTYESLLAKQQAEIERLSKSNSDLEASLKKSKQQLDKKEEELREAQKTYETQLAQLTKTNKEEFDKWLQDLTTLRDTVGKLTEDLSKQKTKNEEEGATAKAQKDKLEGDIKHLNKRIRDQEDRLAAVQAKSSEAPLSMRTDWKIVKMDARGKNPYINLGSVDKVKPQLTFSIHGVGLDGRPNPKPKGTLEVVNVINDHLSQTRITSVVDRNRDPVLEGDIIYNPAWNPTLKKHVAVAGLIDLTGDGRDSLYEFMRNLDRQNVVVDAYLDPKDGSVKGKITFRTDFLILGDVPDPSGRTKITSDTEKRLLAGRNEMINEAKKYGVRNVGLMGYLEMIGYRMPSGPRDERPIRYNPDLRPDTTPRLGGDNPPPAKPPDR
jgi:hypothetical protein